MSYGMWYVHDVMKTSHSEAISLLTKLRRRNSSTTNAFTRKGATNTEGRVDLSSIEVWNDQGSNIGIKHDFPFINIRKVPREVLKIEGEARGFQHLPRDLANVNEWQNHVWSLLLHKFKDNTPKIEKMFAHFILQRYDHFLTRARFL